MHRLGDTRALPAEKDRVVGGERKGMKCNRPRCRHQDQSRLGITIGEKGFPRGMPPKRNVRNVIKSGSLEAPVVENEAARLDQIDLDAETGRKTKQRTGILRNIRLVQGEAQRTSMSGL